MLPRSMLSSQYNTNLNDTKLFKTDHCHRYTCEFNITQYGEDSMTDLTQYSEKVEIMMFGIRHIKFVSRRGASR